MEKKIFCNQQSSPNLLKLNKKQSNILTYFSVYVHFEDFLRVRTRKLHRHVGAIGQPLVLGVTGLIGGLAHAHTALRLCSVPMNGDDDVLVEMHRHYSTTFRQKVQEHLEAFFKQTVTNKISKSSATVLHLLVLY